MLKKQYQIETINLTCKKHETYVNLKGEWPPVALEYIMDGFWNFNCLNDVIVMFHVRKMVDIKY